MKKKFFYNFLIILIILLLLSACTGKTSKKMPIAENGILDLTDWDFNNDGIIQLNGNWKFYWKKFLYYNDFKDTKTYYVEDSMIKVPGLWSDIQLNNKTLESNGYGTYKLTVKLKNIDIIYGIKILDVATSYILYVNGKEVALNGTVSDKENDYTPQFLPLTAPIIINDGISSAADEFVYLDIIIHAANYTHKKAGLWESIYLGELNQIKRLRENTLISSFFIFGIIFIMGFYHFGIYFLRKKDTSPLFFGILAILIGSRILVTGERVIVNWFPDINFQLLNKMDYLTAYSNIALIAIFVYVLFRGEISKRATQVIAAPGLLFALLIMCTPLSVYSHAKTAFDLYVVTGGIAIIIILIRLSLRKVNGALIALTGFFIMYITGINDVLYNAQIINTFNMVPFGLFFYIISQSYLLSKLFTNAFSIIEDMSEELFELNKSYSRFVPHQFLSFLGHKSITDVKKGDHVQKEMTVFFSDIRSFTSLSEKMTPDDNFKFLNTYLSRVSPIIRDMNGFIDKFIGDAIMALFPDDAEHALKASISIFKELHSFNLTRIDEGLDPINIGIALHTGTLMLGTIGEENRMDGTVISDAVNLASRMEGLTKVFGTSIIISDHTLSRIENPGNYNFRYLGNVHVKGKDKSVQIYDFFDGDSESIISKKIETLGDYNEAIKKYYEKEFSISNEYFSKVLNIFPEDITSSFYKSRIQRHIESGGISENEVYIRL